MCVKEGSDKLFVSISLVLSIAAIEEESNFGQVFGKSWEIHAEMSIHQLYEFTFLFCRVG